MTQNSYSYKPRKPLDWALAAEMLAEGCSTAQVAHRIGTTRQNVWRVMKESDVFRRRFATNRLRSIAEAGGVIDGLRGEVAETIKREVLNGNIRVTLWLADRLGLTGRTFPERPRAEDAPANDADPDAELVLEDAAEIARPESEPSTSTTGIVKDQPLDVLTVNNRQQPSPHPPSETAPLAANDSISAAENPISPSTARVCWPSIGAARDTPAGVSENLTGAPSVATRPSTG